MRTFAIILMLLNFSLGYTQEDQKLSTIDFVQILNDMEDETNYYYEQNWSVLRKMAMEKGWIDSYQILRTPYSDEAPFHLMLITTYTNKEQNEKREERFRELIAIKGDLKLLNDSNPESFRKTIFNKDPARHLPEK